ncbi:MAG: hypothetical protein IH840_16965 [Candidatus Heimdallarchaeota archaeon]|nr:hypothetical protein [Candidatus Heimdallarchaeota archaeon]
MTLQGAIKLYQEGKQDKAMEELSKIWNDPNADLRTRLKSKITLAEIYTSRGDMESGVSYAEEVYHKSVEHSIADVELHAVAILSNTYLRSERKKEGLSLLEKTITKYQHYKYSEDKEEIISLANLLGTKGAVESQAGKYDEAKVIAESGLKLAKQDGDNLLIRSLTTYLDKIDVERSKN